jgi:hypothetical protein
MNTFLIVSFLTPPGQSFPKSHWPLHVTMLRPFRSEKDGENLLKILRQFCDQNKAIETVGLSKELFGTHKDILVTELRKTPELISLHADITTVFDPFICFNDMEFKTFRPHVTKQGEDEASIGQSILLNSLSLVKSENEKWLVVGTHFLQ